MQDFSTYFSTQELNFIRSQAILGEKQARFSQELLDLIHAKQWLKVGVPSYNNGNPLTAYEIARLFEALAYADASLGWAINLGAGANMFLGYLEKTTAQNLEENNQLWFAGSGACTGIAVETEAGYKVTGKWSYASGSLYASHFTANAFLQDSQGKQILDENNEPVFKSFIFPASKVEIIDTWNTFGLIASCSNDYKVTDCLVPQEHVFDLTKQSAYASSLLYKYSFDAFAVANIAVMCTGIALHFIELFERDIAAKKPLYAQKSLGEEPQVQKLFKQLTQDFYNARTNFLDSIKKLWQAVENNSENQPELEKYLHQSSRIAADKAYELVTGLYRYCGMTPVFQTNQLSKVVRDLLVATQHYVISPLQER